MLKTLLLLTVLFLAPAQSPVELESRLIEEGKLELLMPKDWKPMSDELIRIKYPRSRPPKVVYSDKTGGISLAFNHTESKASPEQLELYFKVLKQSLEQAFPEAQWEASGFREINGKKIGYFKVTSEAIDTPIFNYLFFTDVDGRLFIGTFNCVEKKAAEWKPIAEQIVSSVKFR